MASPRDPVSQTQPLTPPAEPQNSNSNLNTNLDPSTTTPLAASSLIAQPAPTLPLPSQPPTSLSDPGYSKRPRDARLIHLILASLGVSAYQERVPLQLLDFAYRYTSSVLGDAAHIQAEGYDSVGDFGAGAKGGKGKVGGGGGAAAGGVAVGEGVLRRRRKKSVWRVCAWRLVVACSISIRGVCQRSF